MMTVIVNRVARTCCCLLVLLLTSMCMRAQQNSSTVLEASYARVDGVKYANGKSVPLLADMYLPKALGLRPAIVFIHGGGWTAGNRTSWGRLIKPLAEHGYVGMAIDYDLSPGVRFPVALEECKEAVRCFEPMRASTMSIRTALL